ncbi:MAG: hypothetical protein IAE67_10290 [Candidatus Competibacteraceae bacterium]|nr:hypothetical protein [Candidatus Competibacteraceae bacterium]
MNISKIYGIAGKAIAALFILLGLFNAILIYTAGKSSFDDRVAAGLNIAIYGFLLILALIFIFMLRGVVLNPRSIIKSAISLAVIAIIFFIFYQMATDHITLEGKSIEMVAMVKSIPSSTIKIVEAGLSTLFTLVGLAFAAIIGTEIWKLFK